MKNLYLTILLSTTLTLLYGQHTVSGKVVSVIEGDILEIMSDNNESIIVKVKNVECPEIGQDFGYEARRYTERICLNKSVNVVFERYDKDRNALGVVTIGKKDLGYELIEKGLAWYYQKGLQLSPNATAYLELEKEVKEKEKGLWKNPEAVAPWTFRAHQNKWEGKTSI